MSNIKQKKSREINMKYNLREYWSFLKKYKLLAFLILFLVLINEAVNVSERYLFKILVDKGTLFEAGTLLRNEFFQIVLILAGIFIGALLVKAVCKWVSMHFINLLETKLIVDLKRKYFNHILTLSHSFHTSHRTGSLISRMTRGGRAMESATDVWVFNFSPLLLQLVVVATSLALFDWVSAVVLTLLVVCFIIYSLIVQTKQIPSSARMNQTEDIEKGNISDFFMNIDAIKYFGKEYLIKNRYAKLSDETRKAQLNQWNFHRWIDSGQALILGIGTFLIIYFPMIKFLHNEITLGTLVFAYTAYVMLLGPLWAFIRGMRDVYRVMTDFEDLFQYGKIEKEVKDKENAEKCEIRTGEITFNDIEFNYGTRNIFDKLNLKIKKNEKVALVGHSGSGKTTLVKLLYRFYDVNSGEILIDGKNIKEFEQESLRSELSIVPQEGILFDDTIYNNIAFSNPKATRAEVLRAIRFARLDEFIKRLPLKENTIVGERGVKLSGGEKQRVSIARAILANKKILVLDEATSSLDSKIESDIQKDLWRLIEGRTTIIIAHRLSTIMRADKIVVMDKGKIAQIGTHKELIRRPGLYRELWTLQKGGYIGE
jgi:ATP-binding cassette subfamily B protein